MTKKEYQKLWYEKNHDYVLEYSRKYHKEHREEERIKNKIYNNTEKRKQYNRDCVKLYRKNNKKHVKDYLKRYISKRIINDLNFRLRLNLRKRLSKYIHNGSSIKDLGCSINFLKQHLKSQFTSGMTWQNYGKWEIDHIRPLSSFNLTNKEEVKKAVHYTNLQPLWKEDNMKKSNKII